MRVGFANGCFDLLHEGHRHLLTEAHLQCDRLLIGLNTDESVRALKGVGRPIWDEDRRIGALCQFGEDYPFMIASDEHLYATIKALKPHIIFKGSDYRGKPVTGSDLARVVLIDLLPGYSTTAIAKRRLG